ncbi:MAG: DUF5615 family PIN-like protein [Planctomycetes bacterium]|nr:DUF5615 family PIN-like protein [Planctomycetota bacterium]
MKFLIDACLPRDVAALLATYRHLSVDARDVGLGRAPDPEIAAYARAHQLCLLTED